ncbi:MAG: hypothetical protein AMXMBFR64_62360 [Myxococcales bacterium]
MDQENLPGVLRYRDRTYYCDNCTDPGVMNARNHLQTLYDFWKDRFGWLSWNGMDALMDVTIRYNPGPGFHPPFWQGYTNDLYPPVDPARPRAVFDTGNLSLDFVAHEFGHGMNTATANLLHERHPGALDEHLSDCLAAFVSSDWVLFENTAWSADVGGIRNVANPELSALGWDSCSTCAFTGQPDRWTRFGTASKDHFLTHYNSGIPSKLCYLLAEGTGSGNKFNGQEVDGQGMMAASEVFHSVLRYYLTSASTFEDYVVALSAAALKYDVDHQQSGFPTTLATLDALTAVGLWAPPTTVPTSARALGRVGATDLGPDILLIAFRNRFTNKLNLAQYSPTNGWQQPYQPDEERSLPGGPDFAQERSSPSVDDLVYPVNESDGSKTVIWATVSGGAITAKAPLTEYLRAGDPVSAARLGPKLYAFQRTGQSTIRWTSSTGQSGLVRRLGVAYESVTPPDVVEHLGRLWVAYQPMTGEKTCLVNASESEIQADVWSTAYCPGSVDAYSAAVKPRWVTPPNSYLGGATLTEWDPYSYPAYVEPSKIRLIVSSVVEDVNYPSYSMAQVWVRTSGTGFVVGEERNVMQPIGGTPLAGKAAHVGSQLHQVVPRLDGVLLHRRKSGY